MGQATSCPTTGSRSQRRGYSAGPNNRATKLPNACLQTMEANRAKKPVPSPLPATISAHEDVKDDRPVTKFFRRPKQPRFTNFRNLPKHLQDRIWTLAIPVASPRLFLNVTWWDIDRRSPFARPPWPIKESVITNKQTKAAVRRHWKALTKICHVCQDSRSIILAYMNSNINGILVKHPFYVDLSESTFGFTLTEINFRAYESDQFCKSEFVPKVKHLLINGLDDWLEEDPFFYSTGALFDNFQALESIVFFHSWERKKLAGRLMSFMAAWEHHFAKANRAAEKASKNPAIRADDDPTLTESPPLPYVDRRAPAVAFLSMDEDGNPKFVYLNTGDKRIPDLLRRMEGSLLPRLPPRRLQVGRRLNPV